MLVCKASVARGVLLAGVQLVAGAPPGSRVAAFYCPWPHQSASPPEQTLHTDMAELLPNRLDVLDKEVVAIEAAIQATVAKLVQNSKDRILQDERDRLVRRLASIDAARQELVLKG
jgi:hypothetical protein